MVSAPHQIVFWDGGWEFRLLMGKPEGKVRL